MVEDIRIALLLETGYPRFLQVMFEFYPSPRAKHNFLKPYIFTVTNRTTAEVLLDGTSDRNQWLNQEVRLTNRSQKTQLEG